MKVAAAKALAALVKDAVSAEVCQMYELENLECSFDYIIPKPPNPRILEWEFPAVAEAAMDIGVATTTIDDMEAYRKSLRDRIVDSRSCVTAFISSCNGRLHKGILILALSSPKPKGMRGQC